MSSNEEKLEHPKSNGRVKINVGGTYFETTVSTLTRLDNTVLSTMVADRWQNQEELFVDRSPAHFEKILDYLRDGENFVPPADLEARESLRMEAEFYNLPELAKMCFPGLHVNDLVQWKEEAIGAYWAYCGRYEYHRRRREGEGMCEICGSRVDFYVLLRFAHNLTTSRADEDFMFVKHEMQFMKGIVTEAEEELPAYGERVQINVGGTIFETYLSTVTRFDDSVLSIMVASRWRNEKEIFVDRNPKHFAKVLDYLRDSGSFTPPLDDGAREELRKEAECSPEVFRVGESVQWKQSTVESYCKFLITYWFPKGRSVQCPVCDPYFTKGEYTGEFGPYDSFDNYVHLLHVTQHMLSARGTILSVSYIEL